MKNFRIACSLEQKKILKEKFDKLGYDWTHALLEYASCIVNRKTKRVISSGSKFSDMDLSRYPDTWLSFEQCNAWLDEQLEAIEPVPMTQKEIFELWKGNRCSLLIEKYVSENHKHYDHIMGFTIGYDSDSEYIDTSQDYCFKGFVQDYDEEDLTDNCTYSTDNGKTWNRFYKEAAQDD